MPDIVRYGVLSTAQIALNRHLPAAQAIGNAEIAAISSRDQAKAEASATQYGIAKAYGSYQAVLDDPEIDAIINPLPNSMHCEWTVKAAQAGKHILCEKPLAVTVAQARQMIDAARANGVLLVEAFTHRLNPQLQCARRLVQQGEIGEVKLARAELTFGIRNWAYRRPGAKKIGRRRALGRWLLLRQRSALCAQCRAGRCAGFSAPAQWRGCELSRTVALPRRSHRLYRGWHGGDRSAACWRSSAATARSACPTCSTSRPRCTSPSATTSAWKPSLGRIAFRCS